MLAPWWTLISDASTTTTTTTAPSITAHNHRHCHGRPYGAGNRFQNGTFIAVYWVDSKALFIQLDAATPLMCPVATAQTIIPLDTTQAVSAPLRLLFCASAPLAMSKIEDSHCSWLNSEAIFLPTCCCFSAPCRRDDSSSTSIVNNLLPRQTSLQRSAPSDNTFLYGSSIIIW